jgi:hypothetical protein
LIETLEGIEDEEWEIFINRFEKHSEEKVMIAVLQSVSKTPINVKQSQMKHFINKMKMVLNMNFSQE